MTKYNEFKSSLNENESVLLTEADVGSQLYKSLSRLSTKSDDLLQETIKNEVIIKKIENELHNNSSAFNVPNRDVIKIIKKIRKNHIISSELNVSYAYLKDDTKNLFSNK